MIEQPRNNSHITIINMEVSIESLHSFCFPGRSQETFGFGNVVKSKSMCLYLNKGIGGSEMTEFPLDPV